MLWCVYNSLLFIWTYQITNSATDSSLKEWPLKCIAETDVDVDVDINVEELVAWCIVLLTCIFLYELYNPFAMEQTHIYPILHQGLQLKKTTFL